MAFLARRGLLHSQRRRKNRRWLQICEDSKKVSTSEKKRNLQARETRKLSLARQANFRRRETRTQISARVFAALRGGLLAFVASCDDKQATNASDKPTTNANFVNLLIDV